MDGVTSLHVVRLNSVLVSKGLTTEDQANHSHVDSLSLLKRLLDAQNRVRWLEVERRLNASQGLHKLTICSG